MKIFKKNKKLRNVSKQPRDGAVNLSLPPIDVATFFMLLMQCQSKDGAANTTSRKFKSHSDVAEFLKILWPLLMQFAD